MALTELFGDSLLTKDGEKPTEEVLSGCQAVGIYFSAHWCPPCRAFTPELASRYSAAYEGKGMKIVFVSSDKDEGSFKEYYESMPWLALPFASSCKKQALSSKYGVSGIPTLVILKPDGSLITKDGRACTTQDPSGASFPWSDGPQALGGGNGGAALHRGQTEDLVKSIKARSKAVFYHQLLTQLISAVFCGLYFWGWAAAEEDCESKPFDMKTVFLSLGIIMAVNLVLTFTLMMAGRKVMLNEHALKAAIYQGQDRQNEAQKEAVAARDEITKSHLTQFIACQGVLLCCFTLFAVVWGIICFVSVIDAGKDKLDKQCEDERKLYWGIFISNMAMHCCMSLRQQILTNRQKQASAQ